MEQNENIENTENRNENQRDTQQEAAEQIVLDAEEALGKAAEEESEVADKEEKGEENMSRRERKKKAAHEVEEMTEKLEQMGKKLAEVQDKYVRTYSEYENYRKRTSVEKAELILNGGKDVIKLMLPVIDDMERALSNLKDDDPAKEGMQLILKTMTNALQQKGLKPMDAMGVKFDENFHEAITQIPAPTPETKGMVIDVVKKGYFLNDSVLRFAQVVVGC